MRKLHRGKERERQNLLLLEGTNLINAANKAGCELVTVCCTLSWRERHQQLWENLVQQAQRIEIVSPEVLGAIATTANPDGVIATIPRQTATTPIIAETKLALVTERLQDPGNLGTIIRTAAAVGADGLWLSSDSVDVGNLKVLRASAGAWFELAMAVSEDLFTLIKQHKQQGIQIVATSVQATATYWEVDFNQPTLILLGNEGAGLSSELIALADWQVKIPLKPQVESLNVAIAAALLLYEVARQRQFNF